MLLSDFYIMAGDQSRIDLLQGALDKQRRTAFSLEQSPLPISRGSDEKCPLPAADVLWRGASLRYGHGKATKVDTTVLSG